MSKQLEKHLDGTYTRLLMRVQNISKWKQHFTLEQIYGNLPKASDVEKKLSRRSLSTCERGNHI